MLTAILVLLSVMAVLAAGEAVRGQCRRMLVRPMAAMQLGTHEAVSSEAHA
jgi:hypothetical protein